MTLSCTLEFRPVNLTEGVKISGRNLYLLSSLEHVLQAKNGQGFPTTSDTSGLIFSGLAYGRQILLPETPETEVAPSRGERGADEDYRRKRKHMNKKIDKQLPEEQTASKKREDDLIREANEPTPLAFAMTFSLLYNTVSTSGSERQNYEADPSAHIAFFYKPQTNRDSAKVNLWLGFRSYFVTGSGRHYDTAGVYSFGYFGPIIGVGKFDPGIPIVKRKRSAASTQGSSSRGGYFLLAGVAGQTREGDANGPKEEEENDFDSKAIGFDSPGVWAEFWYTRLYYNALSWQFLVGAQTGDQKTFIYAGFGVGGWR